MEKIHKIYPDGKYSLNKVDFSVREGEIHGLIGENGAGKTTLMRILYGIIKPSKGRLLIKGTEVSFQNPLDAIKLGIGMVQQQFALINTFTITENIVLGAESNKNIIFNRDKANEIVQELSKKSGLIVDPDSKLGGLSIGVKQRVEILKMLYRGAKILILDEPTSVLTPTEVKDFFKILKKLKAQGSTIILVTHKLKEVLEICDRVTVLRGGKVSGVKKIKECTPQMLANMMVGREVIFRLKKKKINKKEKLLEIRGLTIKNDKGIIAVNDLSFELWGGEIFCITGIEGNGQTELVEALTGLREIEKGEIHIKGKQFKKLDPNIVRNLGVAHIPADKDMGLIRDFSVEENLILGYQSVQPYNTVYGLNFDTISSFAKNAITNFNIVTLDEKSSVRYLSGGNQQRVVVAREFTHKPGVIIAAQPTRGLDIASTEYVRSALLKMRDEKKGILLITTDLDEAIQLSDRLGVIYRGSFIGIKNPDELTEEKIGLMMGGQPID